MKIKEFFKNTKEVLGIKSSKKDLSKIERLEKLLTKLEKKKSEIKSLLKDESISPEKRKDLQDELDVYIMQIKKGEEILDRKTRHSQ